MRLSIWDIYYALDYDNMLPLVQTASPTIRNARLVSSANLSDDAVYVVRAGDFLGTDADDTLIMHRGDQVFVRGASVEQVFDDVCDVIDLYYDWERAVKRLVGTDDALQSMLDVSAPILRAPAFVYAPDGSAFALSREYSSAIHWHWAEILANRGITSGRLRKLRDSINLPEVWKDSYPRTRRSAMGEHAYMHCSLKPHGRMAGHFVLFGFEKPFYRGLERMVDILVKAMTEHMESCYWLYNPTSHLADVVAHFLEGGDLDQGEVDLLMRALNWNVDDTYRVLVVRERTQREPVLLSNLLTDISRKLPSVIVTFIGDELVVVENASRAGRGEDAAMQIAPLLRGDFVCGASMARNGIASCRGLMAQARHEALQCIASGSIQSRAEDHCRERMFEVLRRDDLAPLYAHPSLLRLKEHDEERGSALYETLRAYVLASFHLSDAARALGLHRNSLDYRLKRIREIADISDIDALSALPDDAGLMYLVMSFVIIDALQDGKTGEQADI